MRKRTPLHHLLATSALVPLGLGFGLSGALANPLAPQVVGGSASVSGVGTGSVVVQQSSDRAIINWRSFDIGAGERVQFVQPDATSIALNRVTGGLGPSMIAGTLSANGRVFLVNPDGILFGAGAVVDTAGFLATTHDIRNDDFMAGRFNFSISGRPDASVVNLGTITASNAGFAALVAPGVRNAGTITARLGTVALASGNGFSLDFYGDRLITLAVNDQIAATVKDVATGQPLGALVKNEGRLRANGGQVQLSAVTARAVVDSVINNSGVIEARSVGTRAGKIVLGVPTSRTKVAGAPTQTVKISGKLDVSGRKAGRKGGTVRITGEDIALAGATIDARGAAGGGTVLIGGDTGGGRVHAAVAGITKAALESEPMANATTVTVDPWTRIDASATGTGDGGKVIVWADGTTSFGGRVTAMGGAVAGNGGFVEVSGAASLAFYGLVNTKAHAGVDGTLLLDPADIVIQGDAFPLDPNTPGTPPITTPPLTHALVTGTPSALTELNSSVITVGTLLASLNQGNVVIATGTTGAGTGNITVASGFSWGAGASASSSLTLNAYGSILFNPGVAVTNTGTGSVTLRADSTGIGGGTVKFLGTGTQLALTGGGHLNVFYNPAVFGTPDFQTSRVAVTGGGRLNVSMLVNNAIQLQAMGANPSEKYALGRSLDLTSQSGGAGFTPIPVFAGTFDGLGQSINGLTINGTNGLAAGLFSVLGPGGVVKNLTLSNVNVTTSAAFDGVPVFVGALAGLNAGTIENVSVSGRVSSNATGAMVGGLVGYNFFGAVITDARTNVTVTAGANAAALPDTGCGLTGYCSVAYAGGIAGMNFGTIQGSQLPPDAPGAIADVGTLARGDVSVGAGGIAGGLVGWNGGVIDKTRAFGTVTGAAGRAGNVGSGDDLMTALGGLVGENSGLVKESRAYGDVGSAAAYLEVGGLAGRNAGTITDSEAHGGVTAGDHSTAGGLVGTSTGIAFDCPECFEAGDLLPGGVLPGAYLGGSIVSSRAFGDVRVGEQSLAGGFAGSVASIVNSEASGQVTGGANSILGGFAGLVELDQIVSYSKATGAVTAQGSNAWVGGFVGINAGFITAGEAYGAVQGTANSLIGGFAGLNVGRISLSGSASNVTGSGANNILGGLVGVNFGSVDLSVAEGNVSGGLNSIVGGLVGANAAFANVPTDLVPASTFPVGTIYASQASGATSGTVTDPQVGTNGVKSLPAYPAIVNTCDADVCNILRSATLTTPPPPVLDDIPLDVFLTAFFVNLVSIAPPQQQQEIVQALVEIAQGPQAPAGATPGQPTGQPGQPGTPAAGPATVRPAINPATGMPPQPLRAIPGIDGERFSSVPPINETRFISNEVVVQVPETIAPEEIARIAQQLGLSVINTQSLGALGRRAYRFNIGGGRSVRDIIRALEANRIVAVAQPNYTFVLTQPTAPASAPTTTPDTVRRGDPSQYVMGKLHLNEAHRIADGKNILIAVIDSEVDKDHRELSGVISQRYAASGSEEKAHSHGTAMAGAIASRDRLLGVAPSARILAVRAFSEANNTAESTTFSILRSIDWAVAQGAKVINMSFAGPPDPSLHRTLKVAADKGVILIGAAGNAGPKSPPLYPGADPNVIAVTATDANDQVFKMANRGPHVAIAAPGVDILAPAPAAGYQLSTGTSIATAHVTGVVALMLEKDPTLTAADVRQILTSTAKDIGGKGKDNNTGWGLVDPFKALQAVMLRDAARKRQQTQ